MTTETQDRASAAQSLPGEEDLRFIRNFHDIFLSLGITMFVAGLAIATWIILAPIVAQAVGAGGMGIRPALLLVSAAWFTDAAILWLMAEFFARGRRLALPSIVILLAFSLFIFAAAGAAYGAYLGLDEAFFKKLGSAGQAAIIRQSTELYIAALGATTVAIFAFYARMKLPFAMGLGASSLTGVAVAAALHIWPDRIESIARYGQLYSGLFLFLLGIFFDARDPSGAPGSPTTDSGCICLRRR